MSSGQQFNIRVYGLLIVNNCVLVSDEFLFNKWLTKFPGGGLEWGEGISDCLKREFKEELNLDIYDLKHFYTTDYFQQSFFNENHQIISIYYKVSSRNISTIETSLTAPHHENPNQGSQFFRWVELKSLVVNDFYFPIDKIVVAKLQKLY